MKTFRKTEKKISCETMDNQNLADIPFFFFEHQKSKFLNDIIQNQQFVFSFLLPSNKISKRKMNETTKKDYKCNEPFHWQTAFAISTMKYMNGDNTLK